MIAQPDAVIQSISGDLIHLQCDTDSPLYLSKQDLEDRMKIHLLKLVSHRSGHHEASSG